VRIVVREFLAVFLVLGASPPDAEGGVRVYSAGGYSWWAFLVTGDRLLSLGVWAALCAPYFFPKAKQKGRGLLLSYPGVICCTCVFLYHRHRDRDQDQESRDTERDEAKRDTRESCITTVKRYLCLLFACYGYGAVVRCQ